MRGVTQSSTGRARTDAEERGLAIDVCERPHVGSLEESALHLGLQPDGIVKSLVIRRGAGDYIFALLAANRSLSWPLLRSAAAVNRMSLPDADEAFRATGYERGTISPIGSTTPWPVFVDASAAPRIAIGSGSHQYCVIVDRDDFVAAYSATLSEFSE